MKTNHWLFSNQFHYLTNQNKFWLDLFTVYLLWSGATVSANGQSYLNIFVPLLVHYTIAMGSPTHLILLVPMQTDNNADFF